MDLSKAISDKYSTSVCFTLNIRKLLLYMYMYFKYISDFKKAAIIVLCNETNADSVVVSNSLESNNIHVIKLAINSIKHLSKIEDINDVLNNLLINFTTEKSDEQSRPQRFANFMRSKLHNLPSCSSLPSLPSFSKKFGKILCYFYKHICV